MAKDNSARIAEIQKILQSGATSASIDGQNVSFDHASLRRELRQLMAEDATQRSRRPVASRIDLSGF